MIPVNSLNFANQPGAFSECVGLFARYNNGKPGVNTSLINVGFNVRLLRSAAQRRAAGRAGRRPPPPPAF